MDFIKEYWWCFLILFIVITLAVTGLSIGYNINKKEKTDKTKDENKQ